MNWIWNFISNSTSISHYQQHSVDDCIAFLSFQIVDGLAETKNTSATSAKSLSFKISFLFNVNFHIEKPDFNAIFNNCIHTPEICGVSHKCIIIINEAFGFFFRIHSLCLQSWPLYQMNVSSILQLIYSSFIMDFFSLYFYASFIHLCYGIN